jgi:hypothetical protein
MFSHAVVKHKGDVVKAHKEIYDEGQYKDNAAQARRATVLAGHPNVRGRIMEIMHLVYTPEELQADIQEIRKATKPIVYNGEITDTHPDYGVRLELLKLYLKSANVLGVESGTTNNVQFNVNVIDPETTLKLAKEINQLSAEITPSKSGKVN